MRVISTMFKFLPAELFYHSSYAIHRIKVITDKSTSSSLYFL